MWSTRCETRLDHLTGSYDNFCLFCHIENSTKPQDGFAFWIFFTFKDWKRLLLADGPRQSINGIILYSFAYANSTSRNCFVLPG